VSFGYGSIDDCHMREIKLKFLLDETSSRELQVRLKALKVAAAVPKRRTLRSIYLDAPEHGLKTAGMTLRVRRDGRRWIETVKTKREIHGGLSHDDVVKSPTPGYAVPNCAAEPQSRIYEPVRT
jgi:triphosphatase